MRGRLAIAVVAAISETLRFDLTRLREAWRDGYRQEHGVIIIGVAGHADRPRYEF